MKNTSIDELCKGGEYGLFLTAQKDSETLKEQLFALYTLYTFSKNLNRSFHLDDFFKKSLAFLRESLRVKDISLMLINDNGDELQMKMWESDEIIPDNTRNIKCKVGEGIPGTAYQTGFPIVIQDISKEKRFLFYENEKIRNGSFLAIPLKISNSNILGILNIHQEKINAFQENEIVLFSAIADNMAHSIEKIKLYEKAQKQSMFDDLTNLYARRHFLECILREYNKAKRYEGMFSVVMIDIDHFKYFNDTYGHPIGDKVLKKVAKLIKNCVRQGDVVSRYGGEEIAILLLNTEKDGATITAEKIRDNIEKYSVMKVDTGKTERITITAGVASYPEDGNSVEELMAAADKYLYLGKDQGRNIVINNTKDKKISVHQGKRLLNRYKLALKAVAGKNHPQFLEIKSDYSNWKMCGLRNISKKGLKGETELKIITGNKYVCRVVLDSDVQVFDSFTLRVTYTKRINDSRYQFGAEVIEGKDTWRKLYALVTY